jgi:hypothetical protein
MGDNQMTFSFWDEPEPNSDLDIFSFQNWAFSSGVTKSLKVIQKFKEPLDSECHIAFETQEGADIRVKIFHLHKDDQDKILNHCKKELDLNGDYC